MKHENQQTVEPGEVKAGCMLWLCIIAGFLVIAGAVLAAMAMLAPGAA